MKTSRQQEQQARWLRAYGPALTLGIAGLALSAAGLVRGDAHWALLIVGATLVLAAVRLASVVYVARTIVTRLRPLDDLFAEGMEVGRNMGYREGRRAGKPVVVPLACPGCGHRFDREKRTG